MEWLEDPSKITRARVLVVDDDPSVAKAIIDTLAILGHEVIGAVDNAEAAVSAALDQRPDLVLMDVQLKGGRDGVDAALRIRDALDVPIVFVTAYLDERFLDRAARVEPYGVVLKPFAATELLAATTLAVCKHRAFAALEERVRTRTAALLQSEARSRKLATVAELGVFALRHPDAEPILAESVARVKSSLGCDDAYVWRPDPEHPVEPGSQLEYVLRAGEPVVANDLAEERRFTPERALVESGVASGIFAAIEATEGPPHGVLRATSRSKRTFTLQDVAFVEAVAHLIGTVLDRVRADEARRAAERAAEERRIAVETAEAALRARDEFVSIVAHELRTPLAAIRLDIDVLALRDDTIPPPIARALERIARCFDRLNDTLETVLDLSRLTFGRIVLRPSAVMLDQLIGDIVDRLSRHAERAGCDVRVHVDAGLRGYWDAPRIEQILVNLLTNAFRYAPGAPVEVSAESTGDFVEVRVTDHGEGVPESEVERIFQRFERADTDHRRSGLGVGLYVSREIAEAHGGSLELEPGHDHGATFVLRLPREVTGESAAVES